LPPASPSIVGGATWTNTLVDAIRGATAVLVAVSPDAVDAVDVGKEIAVAIDAKRTRTLSRHTLP